MRNSAKSALRRECKKRADADGELTVAIVDNRVALLESQMLAMQERITELESRNAGSVDIKAHLDRVMPEVRRELLRREAEFQHVEELIRRTL